MLGAAQGGHFPELRPHGEPAPILYLSMLCIGKLPCPSYTSIDCTCTASESMAGLLPGLCMSEECRHALDSLMHCAVRLPRMCSRHHGRGAPLLLPHVQEKDLVNDAGKVLMRAVVLGSTQLQPCGTPAYDWCTTTVPLPCDKIDQLLHECRDHSPCLETL